MSKCGKDCEIYSRIVGYFRPIHLWNHGKQAEFNERKTFDMEKAKQPPKTKALTLKQY